MRPRTAISRFSGVYDFLSNFYSCVVTYDGAEYPSVEHAYQAAKIEDKVRREEYRWIIMSAGQAKRLGNQIPLRQGWDDMRPSVMRDLLLQKFPPPRRFENNGLLVEEITLALTSTHPVALIEGNVWHDNFWGVCRCDRCPNTGLNKLGELLEEVRGLRLREIS